MLLCGLEKGTGMKSEKTIFFTRAAAEKERALLKGHGWLGVRIEPTHGGFHVSACDEEGCRGWVRDDNTLSADEGEL